MLNPEITTLTNVKQQLVVPSSLLPSHSTVDVQYELCQAFMRQTGQHLHHKEAELMLNSQDLISQMASRQEQRDKGGEKDSGGEETAASFNLDRPQEQSASPLKASTGRKIEARTSGWLKEVEEKCSPLCVAGVKTLIWDHQQLLENRLQAEARHKLLSRKHSQMERIHEQNLILKKRLETESVKSDSLRSQLQGVTGQRSKALEYAQKKLQQVLSGQRSTEINSKVFREIKSFLEDKQKSVSSRVVRAELIEGEMINHIEQMAQGACEGCCQLLRRVKDSLVRIKTHLEQETGEMDKIYHKYKKTLFVARRPPL